MAHKLGTLLVAATLCLAPATARASGDVPPKAGSGAGSDAGGGIDLPPAPTGDGGDAGSAWSRPDPAEIARAHHAAAMEAAFGAAGAFAGLGVLTLSVALQQPDPGMRRGWLVAAGVFGVLAVAALATGTVLWLTPPESPVEAALVPAGAGVRLALRF